ncbi:MAG: DHA2 family efflux MFS transporter permease subunit [Gammaproteobacteria bacterium]|nr:DHA2 family efflux MFS transporter permease subunit [Gammaproteobacteria bacterium]
MPGRLHAALADPASTLFGRACILLTCTGVTFLYAMTVTVANVSLPQMQGSLSATQDQIAWVVTLNIVATAIATPMSAWLVSRLGRRRLMIYCVIGFALASLACGLATSLETLVLYRVLQGACGAPLVPVSQAIVQDTNPKSSHGIVLAFFGVGSVLGPIVGPVLGGYLSELYNWRWVFFMILPFTALALVAVMVFLHDSERPSPTRLDWTGLLTLAVTVTCVQLLLDRGERRDWFESGEIVAYGAIAAIAFYLFVTHSLTARNPFLNPGLLRDRNFSIGLVIVFVFGMLNFTPMTLIPPLLQSVGGYPDSIIGFILGARGSGTLLAFLSMIYISRFDPRKLIACGFLLQAAAGWSMAQLDVNLSTWDVFWPVFIQGFGVGMLWVPITMVTFSTLSPRHTTEGTAVYHLLRNLGSSIHISVSIALVIRMTQVNYAEIAPAVSPLNELISLPWVLGRFDIDSTRGLAALSGEVSRQARMIGYINSFYFFSMTALLVLPLIFLIKRART